MADASGEYLIYSELADWWPLISPLREYTQEAAYLAAVIDAAASRLCWPCAPPARRWPCAPPARRWPCAPPARPAPAPHVLDLGSGGGHVAVHLKDRFRLTLVDISEPMLAVSRRLNPDCVHRHGDMRTVRLGRAFDVVLVHDAIDYIIGVDDLRQVIQTAAAHCRPGGIALFVPDYIKETFAEVVGGGGGGGDLTGRSASFSERTWDPDPTDDWVQADYEFTLRAADGGESVVRESHRLSAFGRDTWLSLLAEAGFDPEPEFDSECVGRGQRPANLFVARLVSSPAA